jgi:hypothetical protein
MNIINSPVSVVLVRDLHELSFVVVGKLLPGIIETVHFGSVSSQHQLGMG